MSSLTFFLAYSLIKIPQTRYDVEVFPRNHHQEHINMSIAVHMVLTITCSDGLLQNKIYEHGA